MSEKITSIAALEKHPFSEKVCTEKRVTNLDDLEKAVREIVKNIHFYLQAQDQLPNIVTDLSNDILAKIAEVRGGLEEQFSIVTLVGSSKQKEDWEKYQRELALKGYCVLAINIYLGLEKKDYNKDDEVKRLLCQLHHQKIRMADIVAIIPKLDGTVGSHTQEEIDYAKKLGKKVVNVVELLEGGTAAGRTNGGRGTTFHFRSPGRKRQVPHRPPVNSPAEPSQNVHEKETAEG